MKLKHIVRASRCAAMGILLGYLPLIPPVQNYAAETVVITDTGGKPVIQVEKGSGLIPLELLFGSEFVSEHADAEAAAKALGLSKEQTDELKLLKNGERLMVHFYEKGVDPKITIVVAKCVFVIVVVITATFVLYKIYKLCDKISNRTNTNTIGSGSDPLSTDPAMPGRITASLCSSPMLQALNTAAAAYGSTDTNVYSAIFYGGDDPLGGTVLDLLTQYGDAFGLNLGLIPGVGDGVVIEEWNGSPQELLDSLDVLGLPPVLNSTNNASGQRVYSWNSSFTSGSYFGQNGQPVQSSPISFDSGVIAVAGSNMEAQVLQRSTDSVNWESVATNILPAGMPMLIGTYGNRTNRSEFFRVINVQ